ncbi:MAG: DUF4422 domain-containing protein [Lachnospiraceae bacterium]|nr:DUF4422 domain-containing protein [Lachnospiraceae bacterium]
MSESYYVFGAHPRGRTLYEYLRTLKPQDRMLGFLFDNDEVNPDEADGMPVIDLRNLNSSLAGSEYDLTASVYIATRGEYHEVITGRLSKLGFNNIIPVTPELDMDLRNRYVERSFREKGKRFYKIEGVKDALYDGTDDRACLFIAKTPYDSEFEKPVPLKEYEKIIQAGCALTDARLKEAAFFDNESLPADNISDRNAQFSEMTALYWIWKHSEFDFAGLEHWRRRFLLPNDWIDIIEQDGIDVILPVPLCVMPSLEENYKGRHIPGVWDEAMRIIGELHTDEHVSAVDYFKENRLYSPCNMLIARREVLDDYCSWVFPILLELNDRMGTFDDKYQNRYPGFVSERLLTYFFDVNSDKYNVAYADKSFLK